MYVISNSFHSGRESNRISSHSKLASVQKHNSRGYFSSSYDSSKIINLVGNAGTLVKDTTTYINKKFEQSIADYNKKQKRKDRKIDKSATDYFAENKNLDIANEVIFQLGDKQFWKQFRTDVAMKTSSGKVYVKKSFDKNVKEIMNHLYLRQAQAYENIYKTHKQEILKKMYAAKENAEVYMNSVADSKKAQYLYLSRLSEKKRADQIKKMTAEDYEEFAEFFEHYNTLENLERKKLIERTEADEMIIKIINLAAHYDEYDPHAHGISVCSAKNYANGLNERVAKAVVLNKYALEVIQERMREIAKEEMLQHPELFAQAVLKSKETGRNFDYSVNEYKSVKIREEIAELNRVVSEVKENLSELLNEADSKHKELREVEEQSRQLKVDILESHQIALRQKEIFISNSRKIKDQEERLSELMTADDYIKQTKTLTDGLECVQKLTKAIAGRKSLMRDKNAEKELLSALDSISFDETLSKLKVFEIAHNLKDDERVSVALEKVKKSLDDQVNIAAKTRQSVSHSKEQRKKSDERSI